MAQAAEKVDGMKPIEESLLGVDGIEQAHVRVADDGPTGVRIVLASDADRDVVADSIKALFTTRGLTVAVDNTSHASVAHIGHAQPSDQHESGPVVDPEPSDIETQDRDPSPVAPPTISPIDLAVAVSEGSKHCDVAVRIGRDHRAVRRANPDLVSIREAVLDALNEASGRNGIRPTIVSVEQRTVAQKPMVTVVLESAGQVGVGSALVRGTDFHAFGVAAMAALQYLPGL